jgi:hypothetical protein
MHDHAPVGKVTEEEMAAYCRLNGIIPDGPLLSKAEVRTGPHPQSYRPELKQYSCLTRDRRAEQSSAISGKPVNVVLKVPAGFFKCTKEEQAHNQRRALVYA